jgi:hypothetical protein
VSERGVRVFEHGATWADAASVASHPSGLTGPLPAMIGPTTMASSLIAPLLVRDAEEPSRSYGWSVSAEKGVTSWGRFGCVCHVTICVTMVADWSASIPDDSFPSIDGYDKPEFTTEPTTRISGVPGFFLMKKCAVYTKRLTESCVYTLPGGKMARRSYAELCPDVSSVEVGAPRGGGSTTVPVR